MLEVLRIKNFAIIDEMEIPFGPGLNILSGETGAGKSIVLSAIGFLLGGRAQADAVRRGCDEAIIEGLFDGSALDWLGSRLETLGLVADGSQLLIRRVLSVHGRNRVYINGHLATVQILQTVAEGLVDLCGQHEHQSLLKAAYQCDLLDRSSGSMKVVTEVRALFNEWKDVAGDLSALKLSLEERTRRLDYLRFQMQEIDTLSPRHGEYDELLAKRKLLQSSEARQRLAEEAKTALEGGGSDREGSDASVLDTLRRVEGRLQNLAQLDSIALSWTERFHRIRLELDDLSLELGRYTEASAVDSGTVDAIETRIDGYQKLKRKFGAAFDELDAEIEKIQAEVRTLENSDSRYAELEARLLENEKKLHEGFLRVTKQRKQAAKKLESAVEKEFRELRMAEAKFQTVIETSERLEDATETGLGNKIEFRMETNPGEGFRPLAKIASGGELSRVMLALRQVVSDRGQIGVYLFDEIDSGMSGPTAFEVGKKLKRVAAANQVICITHLAQVAAFADHHLVVEKRVEKNRTSVEIQRLGEGGRETELARMLGTDRRSQATVRNARELVAQAQALH